MNQILSTNMPQDKGKKNRSNKIGKPVDVRNVIKVFSIALILFSVCLISTAVYSIYEKNSSKQIAEEKPTISIENKTETTLLMKVMHKKNIEKVEYGWNDEQTNIINGNKRKYIEEKIEIPAGKNILKVKVTDENGNTIDYQKEYEINSNINLEVVGNKIKITYSGDEEIAYMTYRWDEGEESTININSKEIKEEIDAIKGLHTLTVVVVDANNKTETKVQKINGVSKPKLTIDLNEDKTHFVIKASDDEGFKKIQIRLNQDDKQKYVIDVNDSQKEIDYEFPIEIKNGENLIEVKIFNVNDISEEVAAKFIKQ